MFLKKEIFMNVSINDISSGESESASSKPLEETWLKAIDNDPMNVNRLPDSLKSRSFYVRVLELGHDVFLYLPDELKDAEMSALAFKANYMNFMHFSDELKTKEICREAVRKNRFLFRHIPDELKSGSFLYELTHINPRASEIMSQEDNEKIYAFQEASEKESSSNRSRDLNSFGL